jgi:hypothetical protein
LEDKEFCAVSGSDKRDIPVFPIFRVGLGRGAAVF